MTEHTKPSELESLRAEVERLTSENNALRSCIDRLEAVCLDYSNMIDKFIERIEELQERLNTTIQELFP